VPRRQIPFVLACLVVAAVCARLGVWQLSRLGERRARNEYVRARLDLPGVALDAIPADSGQARFRRAEARGRYDYAHEVVLESRAREGSPGVHVVTPLRLADRDTAVLVKRGWVYSPDASTVELARWREGDTASVRGFVDSYGTAGQGEPGSPRRPRAYRWLDRARLERELGYPLAGVVLVAQGDTAGTGANRIPVRLEPPPLDEGPHWNYAVQWFAFGGVALAGMVAVLTSARRKGRERLVVPPALP
jgi:surfeit locus 1 family protein